MSERGRSLKLVDDKLDAAPKRPWFKFFPADWRADPKLRACSLGARGLWMEMVGLMHEARSYGHLLVNGHAPTQVELARQVGATPTEVKRALDELKTNDVYSENGRRRRVLATYASRRQPERSEQRERQEGRQQPLPRWRWQWRPLWRPPRRTPSPWRWRE